MEGSSPVPARRVPRTGSERFSSAAGPHNRFLSQYGYFDLDAMKALFPKGDPKEMQAEYEEREQNPKLGELTTDTANFSPNNSADEMLSKNNKLDVEYDLPVTGGRTAASKVQAPTCPTTVERLLRH